MTSDELLLPSIGFGTYKLRGEAGRAAVTSAIETGYRLIDSAYNYENEGTVGAGIRDALAAGIVDRDEIIYTSKLPGRYQHREDALATADGADIEIEDCRWTPCYDCGVCPEMGTEIQVGPTGQRLLPLSVV